MLLLSRWTSSVWSEPFQTSGSHVCCCVPWPFAFEQVCCSCFSWSRWAWFTHPPVFSRSHFDWSVKVGRDAWGSRTSVDAELNAADSPDALLQCICCCMFVCLLHEHLGVFVGVFAVHTAHPVTCPLEQSLQVKRRRRVGELVWAETVDRWLCLCVSIKCCGCWTPCVSACEQLQDEERRRKQQLEEIRKREAEERVKQEEEQRRWREEERARRETEEKVCVSVLNGPDWSCDSERHDV